MRGYRNGTEKNNAPVCLCCLSCKASCTRNVEQIKSFADNSTNVDLYSLIFPQMLFISDIFMTIGTLPIKMKELSHSEMC